MKQIFTTASLFAFLFSINTSIQASSLNIIAMSEEIGNGAFLGIDYDKINPKKAKILNFDNQYGYFVKKVVENSAAHRADLQPFDYLYGIGDREFNKNYSLSDALDYYQKGDEVTVYYVRKDKKRSKKVVLGGHEDSQHRYTTDRNGDEKPFLGVSHMSGRSNYNIGGVPVNVSANSTAEELGIEDGDILTSINDYRILDWGDITMALNTVKAGDRITVQYIHNASSKSGSANINARQDRSSNNSSIFGEEFEGNMERFEEKMERLGEKIEEKAEAWGERVEEKAEVWAERLEETIENKIECKTEKANHDHAYLGIVSGNVSREKARFLGFDNYYGSYIESVIPNTAAQKAGLEIFDYIYGVDEYRTGEDQSLGSILRRYKPGDTAKIMFIRKDNILSKPVTFGKYGDGRHHDICKCEEPFLGVRQYHSDDYGRGNVIIDPVENSTAINIGLEKGDVIRKINGYLIYNWTDVATAVDAMSPGDIIKINYERGGDSKSASGKINAYKDTKECDDDKEEWSLNGTINGKEFNIDAEDFKINLDDLNIDFNWDNDDDNDKRTEPRQRVDITGMEVNLENISTTESSEMRSKYGVKMPIVNNLEISQVNLYPNPSTGMFNLKFDLPQRGDTAIRVFNSSGREIYSYDLSDFSGTFEDNIDISQNGTGAYFLAINQNGNTMTKKIIVSK